MKFFTIITLFSSIAFSQVNMSEHEKVEQQKSKDRQEMRNTEEALKPNEKYNPTKFDTGSLNIDPNLQIEITNHLLGYSLIMEEDRTLNGVKLTGLMNVAYYNVTEKNESSTRKKGRLVFGLEFPVMEVSQRIGIFTGFGGTLGDATALYLDVGTDIYATSWFKIQGALNYTSGKGIGTMINAGFSW